MPETAIQSPPTIPATVREDFPALAQEVNGHPLVYFDNAATTQKPRAVLEAVQRYYEHDNANVHRGIHELSNRATAAYAGARARVAEFLNTFGREEIIFTRGTTESLNPCCTGKYKCVNCYEYQECLNILHVVFLLFCFCIFIHDHLES